VLTAGAAVATTAKSYAQIVGANERVNFAIIGLNGRAGAHLSSLKANQKDSRVTHICDVDTVIMDRFAEHSEKSLGYASAKEQDFRKILASKDVDIITIATPDHWHAPMGIMGLQAGKHVYVEKPMSYCPHEGEMLIAAQKKYGKLAQMGSQQRSSPHTIDIINRIHGGLIGRAYWAKTWYTNRRKPIGVGKVVPVPSTLNWDIWQGPAPRTAYKDNVHPYNWHWRFIWGTGETLNNGTHEVDVARWALGVDYPNRVEASGGRYAANDDWQYYDTINVNFNYDDKLLTWEGDCITGKKTYGRERGTIVHGPEGSVLIDRDGWEHFDLKDKMIDSFYVKKERPTSSADLVGADSMTDLHFLNTIEAIRGKEKLNQPVTQGNVAVTMLQTANYAWELKRAINMNPDGTYKADPAATAKRSRTYEKGWAPHA
jgi:predicted dehydrogenase